MAKQMDFSGSNPTSRPPLMKVEAQPSNTFRPSDPNQLRWKGRFVHQTLAHAHPIFTPDQQTIFRSNATQSTKPRTRRNDEKFRFVHSEFSPKISSQAKLSEAPPPATHNAVDQDRPTKKRCLVSSNPGKTMLSARKPLGNADDVHRDVWRSILPYCHPRFLLQAKLVDKLMYDILSSTTSIWKQSRELHFPNFPPCPSRLTEQQYVELLVGRGCQVPSCMRTGVRHVAWPFLGRICLDCLHHKTLKIENLPATRQHTVNREHLAQALPMSHPVAGKHLALPVLDADGTYLERRGNVVLRSEWERIEAEYLEVQRTNDEAGLKEWYEQKCCETRKFMLQIQAIATQVAETQPWLQETGENSTCSYRLARMDFFIHEAAMLDPPMGISVLDCMSAYHKAINTGNPPSVRAWKLLESKILPYRQKAEELVALKFPPPNIAKFNEGSPQRKLVEQRTQRERQPKKYLREQKFVINLGREEFDKCVKSGVADCDLLLLTLKNVFDRYDKLKHDGSSEIDGDDACPIGLNYDGTKGSYILSYDDAVMIIEEVIEADIRKDSGRGKIVFKSLRCIACHNQNRSTSYDFQHGMEHIHKSHSSRVGEGEEYWRLRNDDTIPGPALGTGYYANFLFPFFFMPWSRCLPLIPYHQNPENMPTWHPDHHWEYVQLDTSQDRSAFEGRVPRYESTNLGFLDMVNHAVGSFRGVNLSSPAIIKIAFRYATARCGNQTSSRCSLEQFMEAIPGLSDSNPALKFNFMCGICMYVEDNSFAGQHIKYPIPLKLLELHWQRKHKHEQPHLDWMTLLHVPSDSMLLEEMRANDQKLQEKQADILAGMAAPRRGIAKKPNPKATAILATRSSQSVLDELFPKIMADH